LDFLCNACVWIFIGVGASNVYKSKCKEVSRGCVKIIRDVEYDEDDVYDHFYVLEYDLTVDPPTIDWRFERKTKKRKALGDSTLEEASNRRRRVPDLLPSGRQNMDIVEENQMGRRKRKRVSSMDLTERIGMQDKSGKGAPWINHIKAVARKHNISHQESLKSGIAKQSYMKGGTNIFNPIDGFKVG